MKLLSKIAVLVVGFSAFAANAASIPFDSSQLDVTFEASSLEMDTFVGSVDAIQEFSSPSFEISFIDSGEKFLSPVYRYSVSIEANFMNDEHVRSVPEPGTLLLLGVGLILLSLGRRRVRRTF